MPPAAYAICLQHTPGSVPPSAAAMLEGSCWKACCIRHMPAAYTSGSVPPMPAAAMLEGSCWKACCRNRVAASNTGCPSSDAQREQCDPKQHCAGQEKGVSSRS
eukprot:1150313-Pelagomonas_calceolata.AAC.8